MEGFSEIDVFVRTAEAKSFTRAGRGLGLTTSGVSRAVARLESRLGVRLLDRSTRSLSLTDVGAEYYARCKRILGELDEANDSIGDRRRSPRGRLRVDAPNSIGRFFIGPALPKFLSAYPSLSVDFSVRDHFIDPIAEGIDVVVRMAELRDSLLHARRLGSVPTLIVAAPSYLARRGRPETLEELPNHECIGFLAGGIVLPWRFRGPSGENLTHPLQGRLHTNSADAALGAAVAGLGLAQLLAPHAADAIRRGQLEEVLQGHRGAPLPVYALFARDRLESPKVRVFLDFLTECFRER
jgi:LysR family transcriptional regulator, regulator for bpeEF and oprC